MTRERTLTKLELLRATVGSQPGWMQARWERSDGSQGRAFARFRRRTRTRWYIAEVLVQQPTSALMRDVPLHRIETAANADPSIVDWLEQSVPVPTATRRGPSTARRYKLERPEGRRLDDSFYARVGVAYRGAVTAGLPPAKTLASDADAPQGTVNRWIAKAREKGKLPEAAPGKVTA